MVVKEGNEVGASWWFKEVSTKGDGRDVRIYRWTVRGCFQNRGRRRVQVKASELGDLFFLYITRCNC